MPRGLLAVGAFLIPVGGAMFGLLPLCERCRSDNAYLGELLLGPAIVLIGVFFALAWVVASRRDGLRELALGGTSGLLAGASLLAIGATRTLIPPLLSLLELLLIIPGAVAMAVIAGRRR